MAAGGAAVLALADGRVFEGTSIGAEGTTVGEVVFTTGMSGYQEVLTDPSYARQIVTMTCAEIGNVGVNEEDFESDRIQAAGLITRSSRPVTSSWRAERSLRDQLLAERIVAVEDIDTRALVLHLRVQGAQMGVLSTSVATTQAGREALVAKAKAAGTMAGRDLAREVTCTARYAFSEAPGPLQALDEPDGDGVGRRGRRPRVAVYDFGVKQSILRRLVEAGADVDVLPATTPAKDVLARSYDGIVFSNGPGDPEPCTYAIEAARGLIGRRPILGICLGHQILALAYGGRSFKLKFGHRGNNHPVRQETSGRVMITSQNHGFAIDPSTLTDSAVRVAEINLNDQTLEGFEVERDQVLAVQYHPEASPGPHDASDHFGRFMRMCA